MTDRIPDMREVMRGTMFFIPLDVAIAPAEGHCFVNRWWAVHPDKGVAFYAMLFGYYRSDEPSPQCHSNEHTARHLMARINPECEVMLLPVVYQWPAQKEMLRLRKEAARRALTGGQEDG